VALRVAIVGPGRVGRAFGRRLARQRATLLGFVGRQQASAAAAVAGCGAGRALSLADLAAAHCVVFAVGDGELRDCVAAAAAATAAAGRPGLWLHTSGRFGLEVFAGLARPGLRFGALHPVAPFPDEGTGERAMAGAPAVLLGGPDGLPLLRRLARLLGLVPIAAGPGDRLLYHAACALAANGLTALRALVDELLAAAGGLAPADAANVAAALLQGALRGSAELGPAAALSGPVRRGDAGTVAAHLGALAAAAPHAVPAYRALMRAALDLAVGRGLGAAAAAAVARALEATPDGARGADCG